MVLALSLGYMAADSGTLPDHFGGPDRRAGSTSGVLQQASDGASAALDGECSTLVSEIATPRAREIAEEYARRLGRSLARRVVVHPVRFADSAAMYRDAGLPEKPHGALTVGSMCLNGRWVRWEYRDSTACVIRLTQREWSPDAFPTTLAHEVFHCFQYELHFPESSA